MNARTLPIGHPPIIGYLHHAFPLAIVSQDERYLPWFHSQYIQVHCPANLAAGPDPARKRKFNFYRPPRHDDAPAFGLLVSRLNRNVVLADGEVMGLIRRAILSGRYVQVCVDEFEIPGKKAFHKRHLLHELFIYGFDDYGLCVETLGFQETGDFASARVAYDDLQRAFDAGATNNAYDPEGLRLFSMDEKTSYRFDIRAVLEGLEDYVSSRNTSERFRMLSEPIDGVFGLATYRCLIEACAQLFSHPQWFDIRPLHILWEHKVCMLRRIRYLEREGYLNPSDGFGDLYASVETDTRTLRMMMLKLRASRDTATLGRIIQRLEQLARDEGRILTCLLETLRVMPYVKLKETLTV
ncbi:MAG: hypothetical protein ACI8V2_004838 [Candidatus Latescibacterota bacterium]|jgi:hypothetical protein